MIKSMAQAIPTYFISIYLFPHTLADENQGMMNSFLWGSSARHSRGIKWMAWDKLTMRKEDGWASEIYMVLI